MQITAKELRELDHKRFEREYWDWVRYAFEHEWWDCIEQEFTDKMAALGTRVDGIQFSIAYSQGDYALFSGRVNVAMWMTHAKANSEQTFAEAFPALYMAVVQDGTYAIVSESYRNHPTVDYTSNIEYTEPEGVFQHLDDEAWRDLVTDQEIDADLETNVCEWVWARCQELYSELRREYEGISSEESFIESCECNDVTFEVDHEICN